MPDNTCDNCGKVAELYHFDAEVSGNPFDGAALCDVCDANGRNWDEIRAEYAQVEDEIEDEGGFHAELRTIIENAEGTPLAILIPQAEALLALPEDSVAAMVAAAQNMVTAVSAAS
jgi:hypothetical protein